MEFMQIVSHPATIAGVSGIVGVGIVLRLVTWHRQSPLEIATPTYSGRNRRSRRNAPVVYSGPERRQRSA